MKEKFVQRLDKVLKQQYRNGCKYKTKYGSENKCKKIICKTLKTQNLQLYCYCCKFCGKWHLTRTPTNTWEEKIKGSFKL